MSGATSRVTTQNQISVPAPVRKRFGIRPGTVLEWLEVDGELVVRPRQVSLEQAQAEVRGMLGATKARKLTLSELQAARTKAVVDKHRRACR